MKWYTQFRFDGHLDFNTSGFRIADYALRLRGAGRQGNLTFARHTSNESQVVLHLPS